MRAKVAYVCCALGLSLTGLALGIGGGGGTTTPPPTNIWWPAGNVWYGSDNGAAPGPGGPLNYVSFSEAWGTARLDALRTQASTINRHALEVSWAWQGNANKVFTRCISWTDMPDAYDDCGTAKVANPEDTATGYSYGTYEVNNLIANRAYNGWINFSIGGPLVPYQGLELKNAFYHKSLYCFIRNQWSCGVLDAQKNINRDFPQDRFFTYYGRNVGPYPYGQ
jgi:hypothetical protein